MITLDYPGDVLGFAGDLTDAERSKLAELRAHLDAHVRPLLIDAWENAETLAQIRDPLAALQLIDDPALLDDSGRCRPLYRGFLTLELSRLDLAVSIVYGGQTGMFRTVVTEGGSAEQVAAWDDDILAFRMTGCFGLTEPGHGSDIAGGLETTARRTPDGWVLDGAKRWIGNATISDNVIVVAREHGGDRVLAFVVPTGAPGVELGVIAHKTALRAVHNADIVLRGVVVGDDRRLPRIESFRDINRAFRHLRAEIAWNAAGMQLGAYDAAARYAAERVQFGHPIASYQLIQEKLVTIASNIAQTLALAVRLTTHPVDGVVAPSLVKLATADRLRESAALAREIVGGNGILLDYDVARFFADAEAMYTFEGTRDVNTLVVGRALTGYSAFTH